MKAAIINGKLLENILKRKHRFGANYPDEAEQVPF